MIDIHTHIIPALDDGPENMEQSISIGRIAEKEGVTAMISTSHSDEAAAAGYGEMCRRLEEVRAAWIGAGLNIRLELGVEIFLTPDTVGDLKSGKLWALAGSQYLLVELPYQPWPTYAETALFDLQLAGYIPILAHPERYTAIQSDPSRMYALAERGILGQVTAEALTGAHGRATQRCASTLVRHRLVQFISTDTHGTVLHKRPPYMRPGLAVAANLIGEEAARAMVTTNPACILSNTPIEPQPERVEPHKWTFGSLFGRR